jgi:hypothetical protein
MKYVVDKSGVLNGEFHAGNLPHGFNHGRALRQGDMAASSFIPPYACLIVLMMAGTFLREEILLPFDLGRNETGS